MKKGFIRIVIGIFFIGLQMISIYGNYKRTGDIFIYPISTWMDVVFYFGYFFTGIVGAILLFFGKRTYRKEIYPQLILHNKSCLRNTIFKWHGFSISLIIFLYYLLMYLSGSYYINYSGILILLSTLSFVIYTLFYLYKKPSGLFSASLILLGCAYICSTLNLLSNVIIFYNAYVPYITYYVCNCITYIIAAVLYIIIGAEIYREWFSIKLIKVLGWIAFSLELFQRVIMKIIEPIIFNVWRGIPIEEILLMLFTIIIFLFISVFEIRSLSQQTINYGEEVIETPEE